MAQKPLRPCRHPGCPVLTRDVWCEKHRPPPAEPKRYERKASAGWHGWYSKPIWTKRLRPQHLIAEPFCRECAKEGLRTRAEVVDHIVSHEGDWSEFTNPDNLQSLCKFHHDQKTMREQNRRRRENRTK